jgi:beta-xylosidase
MLVWQGLIDPTYFKDPATGGRYVVWKLDGNSCGHATPIFAAPVAANGTSVDAKGTVKLISNDQAWEGPLTEAPWLVRQGKYVYLFYSGNVYSKPAYAVGVARATSVAGPWTR